MKADLVRKTDEFIRKLLKKPDLTVEEYKILDKKLDEIKFAETEAARRISQEESEQRLKAMVEAMMIPWGGAKHEQ